MIIVANGCSFIQGVELSDSSKTYPALLSRNHTYYSVATTGASNQAIARTTIDACEMYSPDFVFVQWTFPDRYEFRFSFDTGRRKSPWHDVNIWAIDDRKNLIDEQEFEIQDVTFSQESRSGVSDFAEQFFRSVAQESYWQVYSTLKEIVYLQNYLLVHRIPYLFTAADNIIVNNRIIEENTSGRKKSIPKGFTEWEIPNSEKKTDITIRSLYNAIDFGKFYWWPMDDAKQPRGFYQWAVENKYSVGKHFHPLDEAHYRAAELIQETFNVHSGMG